ncbi:MAG TPA: hypothetical protein VFG04_11345 [Planctomycetaceae bacterium]|nr:hypothetical protein [Planctomycetaceae bacterium]
MRSLCGYASSAGQELLHPTIQAKIAPVKHFRTLDDAAMEVWGPKGFALWHNVNTVISRCQKYIASPSSVPAVPLAIGLQEQILSSHVAKLEQFGVIRHRIAHDQKDAKDTFAKTALALTGKSYRGNRPGKFLREQTPHDSSLSWLRSIIGELESLAKQML